MHVFSVLSKPVDLNLLLDALARVMRRHYGSEVPELIDQPLNGATILRIYAATAHAVLLWEPRIALTGLQLERGQDGKATLILDGVADEQSVQLTVPVQQGGAS